MFIESKFPVLTKKKQSKYRNVKTTIDGIVFDSKKESKVYCELKINPEVDFIDCHPKFDIVINGHKVCTYEADFVVYFTDAHQEVWDAKGIKTSTYNLKKKLMKIVNHIDIIEK